MVVVLAGKPAVDVGQPGIDAVLVTLERVEVGGICEVRGEQLSLSFWRRLRFSVSSTSSWEREATRSSNAASTCLARAVEVASLIHDPLVADTLRSASVPAAEVVSDVLSLADNHDDQIASALTDVVSVSWQT